MFLMFFTGRSLNSCAIQVQSSGQEFGPFGPGRCQTRSVWTSRNETAKAVMFDELRLEQVYRTVGFNQKREKFLCLIFNVSFEYLRTIVKRNNIWKQTSCTSLNIKLWVTLI